MKTILLALIIVLISLISCNKKEENSRDAPSEVRSVSSIVFRTVDNPGLTSDWVGSIGGDSVTFVLSQSISLDSLVPTISFSGKNIEPASKIHQNFYYPVIYTVTA